MAVVLNKIVNRVKLLFSCSCIFNYKIRFMYLIGFHHAISMCLYGVNWVL